MKLRYWLLALAIAVALSHVGPDEIDAAERTAAAARDVERTGLLAAKD